MVCLDVSSTTALLKWSTIRDRIDLEERGDTRWPYRTVAGAGIWGDGRGVQGRLHRGLGKLWQGLEGVRAAGEGFGT